MFDARHKISGGATYHKLRNPIAPTQIANKDPNSPHGSTRASVSALDSLPELLPPDDSDSLEGLAVAVPRTTVVGRGLLGSFVAVGLA